MLDTTENVLLEAFPKPSNGFAAKDQPYAILRANSFVLPHKVTLLFPSTVNNEYLDDSGKKFVLSETLDYVRVAMQNRSGGGATIDSTSTGFWFAVKEEITPIWVYLPNMDSDTQQWIIDLASYVKNTLFQESVMVIVDNAGYLV